MGMPRVSAAWLVIDLLNDFVQPGAPLEVPGARDVVSRLAGRLAEARRRGAPVIYVCDAHQEQDPEFTVWPRHAVRGTRGAQVVDAVAPTPGDRVVLKATYSGFYGTELEPTLRGLGVRELIVTGVCTEICVLYTAVDALMRGYQVTVPPDCVAGLTPEGHRFALHQLTDVLKPAQGVVAVAPGGSPR